MSRLPRVPFADGLLALVGGALVALSLPPWGWWPLAFVGIAVYTAALRDAPPRRRFRQGWLFGFSWLAIGMSWMWFLTAPGYVVASALFAALHGAAALAVPNGRWRILGLPAAHTTVEAIRLWYPFGGVPLATLGISQVAGPLASLARVGGVVLITMATLLIGAALGAVFQRGAALGAVFQRGAALGALFQRGAWTAARSWISPLAAVAAVGVALGIAAVAPDAHATGASLRVAIVQGGGEQGTRAIDTDPRVVFERHLLATRRLTPDDRIDLVLWPENVIDVASFAASPELGEIAAEARRLDAPFAVGVTEDTDDDRFTNAQVVVTPEGEIVSRYEKVRRVPFGEYMPFRGLLDALGAPTDLVPRDAVAGTGPAVLDLPGGPRLAVVISWEVFFGSRARDGVGDGGAVILNPTNGSSYTGTVLQTQQVASSRLRALEEGRWVLQASPTGFSAFVSPSGGVFDRTGVSEQAVLVRDVPLRAGHTWFARLGDLPFAVGAALLAAAAGAIPTARTRRARDSAGEATEGVL